MKQLSTPAPDYRNAPVLAAARARALDCATALAGRCAELGLESVATIAAAGSLGRLEITANSDFDVIVVAHDEASPRQLSAEIEAVFGAARACGLVLPKPDGIYREAVTRATLLDPAARGRLDESPAVYGKRMQCLLDARPLYASSTFSTLRRDVLLWYGYGAHAGEGAAAGTALVNEIARYLHTYATWQRGKHERSVDDSWGLRQAKLWSSRLVTFAGMLLLLGEASTHQDRVAWLLSRLDATPLERIALVMQRHDAHALERLLDAYEHCFARLAEAAWRQRLVDSPRPAVHAVLDEVRDAARVLSRELTRFVLARQDDWAPEYFESLLFWGAP